MRWCALIFHLLLRRGAIGERVLVWQDDFNGDSLNDNVWTVDTGNGCDQGDGLCGWGNFEKQTYTLDNHQVSDGVLAITARREPEQVDQRWYTSSRIRSRAPAAFLTGRVEARIKVPTGLGLWAAFWMLPSNVTRGEWAATGEIDIMEAVNDMDSVLGTIHYGGEYPANRFAGCSQSSGMDFSTDYHLYALEWEMDEMRWYVDEQLFCLRTKWTSDLDDLEPYRAPFDTEFELLLNLAVGGALPGRFVDNTALPATMLVDYIRVYDISTEVAEPQPFFGVPVCLPGAIEAEAYDIGGLGLGYGEASPEARSGAYRIDGVGLVKTEADRTYLMDLTDGDWVAYSVKTDDALYDISIEVSAPAAAAFHLMIGEGTTCSEPGNGSVTDMLAAQATGEDGEWGTTIAYGVMLPEGTHSLKLCVTGGLGLNVDRITFESVDGPTSSDLLSSGVCSSSSQGRPYMFGEPWAIPGYIEAEFYDYGGLGVAFHEDSPLVNAGDSMLRWPDGVDIIEAESNPAHGQYVGDWKVGEWLAFTSRAEEAGYWDVGASIASGSNGTNVQFRLLVNATNCSSAETDGFDGLGSAGVDLLGGPVFQGFTGSWEAFQMAYKEDVWVPEGNHRVLFCADGGLFNLNYLRFWTPTPTPAPTPSPTPAPTAAPQVPSSDGMDTKWIVVSVLGVLGLAALSRLGCIVYMKENRRRKPATLNNFHSNGTSGGKSPKSLQVDGTPPTDISRQEGIAGDEKPLPLPGGVESDWWDADPGAAPSNGHPNGEASHDQQLQQEKQQQEKQKQQQHGGSFEPPHDGPTGQAFPRALSASFDLQFMNRNGLSHRPLANVGGNATYPSYDSQSRAHSGSNFRPQSTDRLVVRRPSVSSAQPLVSPVDSTLGASTAVAALPPLKTPRANAGIEVEQSGSLWDRSAVSPIQSNRAAGGGAAAVKNAGTLMVRPERDQFEDALVRALDSKWDSVKFSQQNPMRPMDRAQSFTEGLGRPNAMLAAGKCWTCVCSFENTVGQASCLGCGRIAPIGQPTTPNPTARARLPAHRLQSWIAPMDSGDV